MKLIWTCSWDGKECEYEKVNVTDGVIIQPEPVKKERGINAPNSWDICVCCSHSGAISCSHPRLAWKDDNGKINRI